MKPSYLLILILLLASCLRLFQLGANPPSLDWDEVSLGYNAYSLLETGRDEYGNTWPLSIRSFNDYKPPAYSYLAIPSVALMGLTEFAVRLPSALSGVVAVAALYLLALQLAPEHPRRKQFALLAAFFLAVSPWHQQFSRAAFEANLALTFYLLSLAFFFTWLNGKKRSWVKDAWFLTLAALAAAASLYSYHSARLVVPLSFLILAAIYRRFLARRLRPVLLALTVGAITLAPLLIVTLRGSATQRFNTVSLFTNPGEFSRERERLERQADYKAGHLGPLRYFHAQKLVYASLIARNYLEHFNFDFLFLRADGNPRHHADGMGLLYLIELPLLLAGSYYLIKDPPKYAKAVWVVLLTGPVAASLTADTPHAIRSLLMLPGFNLMTAYGASTLLDQVSIPSLKTIPKPQQLLKRAPSLLLFSLFLVLFLINLFYYFNLYYLVTPVKVSRDWQFGYRELVHALEPLRDTYRHIIVTNKYDQPHIYFAFYLPIPPREYQTQAETAPTRLGNICFQRIEANMDCLGENTLIAATPEETPADADILQQIEFANGQTAFNLFEPTSF